MGLIRAGLSFIRVKVYSVLVTGIFGMLHREREREREREQKTGRQEAEDGKWRGGPSMFSFFFFFFQLFIIFF